MLIWLPEHYNDHAVSMVVAGGLTSTIWFQDICSYHSDVRLSDIKSGMLKFSGVKRYVQLLSPLDMDV